MNKFFGSVIIILVLIGIPSSLMAQSCEKYFKKGDCRMDIQKDYRTYSQSKSVLVSKDENVEFNIVFYGQKDYIFTFCTDKNLYPVNFKLLDPDTDEILYDNADDRYIESLSIGFDVTRTLKIQVSVLGEIGEQSGLETETGCLGVLFQYKNY